MARTALVGSLYIESCGAGRRLVPYISFDILGEPGQGSVQTLLAVLSTLT